MKRIALIVAVVLAIVLASAKTVLLSRIETTLSEMGWTWEQREDAGLDITWMDLSRPGMTADKVVVDLAWPPKVIVHNPILELTSKVPRNTPMASGKRSTPDVPARVMLRNLSLTWEGETVISGLSGEFEPELHLSGPDGHFSVKTQEDGTRVMEGTATVALDLPHVSGMATVEASTADMWRVRLTLPDAVLSHPLLSTEPLPPVAISADIAWIPETQALALDGTVDEVPVQMSGTLNPDPVGVDLTVRVPMTPLSAIVAVFGERVPEALDSEMVGSAGMVATLKGPPLEWTVIPKAEGLGASGALPADFGGHTVQWRVQDDDGMPLIRQTGPTTAGWVPLAQMGWMDEAATAAEDIRFATHPGYDIEAIREVLDKAPQEARPRGGSTITQQLAKNLFLDGRRTLSRKLRELLLALDLERSVPKEAILALYLNVVEFGPGIYGIGAASDAWFLKDTAQLSPREAAFLASLLPAPQMWHTKLTAGESMPKWQIEQVLGRMARRGDLSPAEFAAAKKETLRVIPPQPK